MSTTWENIGNKLYRDALIKTIRENVEICRNKFGGRTLLATETEPSVVKVINSIELILQDRLKVKSAVNIKNINLNVNHFSFRYTFHTYSFTLFLFDSRFPIHVVTRILLLKQIGRLLSLSLVVLIWSWVQLPSTNHQVITGMCDIKYNPLTWVLLHFSVFWHFVRNHLTRHEQERYYHIQNISSDYGRGRAWLRSSINEHSLDRYLRMLFSDENMILNYYEPSSLMNDVNSRECLLDAAKGWCFILHIADLWT